MSTNAAGAKALNLIVIGMLASSLLVGVGGWLATPAAAQNCAQAGGSSQGDWVVGIGVTQVCQDIVVVMDGDLIVQGTLTFIRGGLKFAEDTAHVYSISVARGGSLPRPRAP